MTLDRIFIGFMIVVGVVVGTIVALRPEVRELRIQPYFWVLIAMLVFEALNYARGRGAPGTMLGMEARLLGFVTGIVLMIVIPTLTGLRPS
jgi:membrane associated rhomboid family serine protease